MGTESRHSTHCHPQQQPVSSGMNEAAYTQPLCVTCYSIPKNEITYRTAKTAEQMSDKQSMTSVP